MLTHGISQAGAVRLYLPRPYFAPEGEAGAAETPVVETPAAPVVEAAPAAAETPAAAEAPTGASLLSEAEGKKPAEPAEAAKPEGNEGAAPAKEGDEAAKAAEAEAAKPEPITFEAFNVPEGLELKDDAVKQFTEILGDPNLSAQERGQKLVDMYAAEVKGVHEAYAQQQVDTWRQLNDSWKEELRSDPEIGGNRVGTTLSIAKAVIEEFGGSKEQQAALLAHVDNNGMGNYAGFVRLLHNIGAAMNVLEDRIVSSPSSSPSAPKSKAERWYGNGKAV